MHKKGLPILIHVAGWIALFLLPLILLNFPKENIPTINPERSKFIVSFLPFLILTYCLLIIFFYANLYYLLPKLYYQGKKNLYILTILLVMIVIVLIVPYIKHVNFEHNNVLRLEGSMLEVENRAMQNGNISGYVTTQKTRGNRPRRMRQLYEKDSLGNFVALSRLSPEMPAIHRDFWRMSRMDHTLGFFNFLIIWLLSTAAFLALRSRNMEQRNKEMKVQKLDAELSYLKAQINPHFLFNTLNNIYALSISESKQTPEAILKLSAMMRYATQESQEDRVPLNKETESITNYIALQQLRSNHNLSVTFDITGDTGKYEIAPLLLISFIENAFKFGVSNHLPCFVNIQITVKNNQLTLVVSNKKMVTPKKDKIPIGITNTKRRLQLQYPDNYQLTIKDENDLYEIKLVINLV